MCLSPFNAVGPAGGEATLSRARGRLAPCEDLNDGAPLWADPTIRLVRSEKVWERGVALPFKLHWFERDLPAARRVGGRRPTRQVSGAAKASRDASHTGSNAAPYQFALRPPLSVELNPGDFL